MSQAQYDFEVNVTLQNNPDIINNLATAIENFKKAEVAFENMPTFAENRPVFESTMDAYEKAENALFLAGRKFAHFIRVGDAQFDSLKNADDGSPQDAKLCDKVFTQKYVGQHNQAWHDRNNAAKAETPAT